MADTAGTGAEQRIERRLRVWATAGEACRVWASNAGLWIKLSIVPVALLIVLWVIAASVLPNTAETAPDEFPRLQFALLFLCITVMFLAEIPRMTAWHRFILTPEDVASHRYLIGSREWRYLLSTLLLTVILYFVLVIVTIASSLFVIPALLPAIGVDPGNMSAFEVSITVANLGFCGLVVFVFADLLLRLSAAAIGRKLTRREAKTAIASNRGRLTGGLAIGVIPILLAGYPMFRLFGAEGDVMFVAGDLAIYIPTLVFGPVLVGILSIAYRDLVQAPDATVIS